MTRSLFLIISLIVFTGCSATKVADNPNRQQYCYADKTIKTIDGTVSSESIVECTDRPANNWQLQLGISDDCREHYYTDSNGTKRRGYVCQKFDGSWEIVPTNF